MCYLQIKYRPLFYNRTELNIEAAHLLVCLVCLASINFEKSSTYEYSINWVLLPSDRGFQVCQVSELLFLRRNKSDIILETFNKDNEECTMFLYNK